MKRSLFFYVCLVFAAVTLYSCGAEDPELKRKIERELADKYPSISASVLNGIATLTGTVESEEQKAEAGEIAKNVKYVRSVTNDIFVRIEEPEIVITPDEAMTTMISEGLNNQGYQGIVVTVSDSVATLKGEAKKADVKKIMQIVNDASPKKVINELTVK
ncbi:MAG: BON domain-containing protein [Dysgonomonas sp.]|nr:BON domain-containing protein [Dysgonomonas sp.]